MKKIVIAVVIFLYACGSGKLEGEFVPQNTTPSQKYFTVEKIVFSDDKFVVAYLKETKNQDKNITGKSDAGMKALIKDTSEIKYEYKIEKNLVLFKTPIGLYKEVFKIEGDNLTGLPGTLYEGAFARKK